MARGSPQLSCSFMRFSFMGLNVATCNRRIHRNLLIKIVDKAAWTANSDLVESSITVQGAIGMHCWSQPVDQHQTLRHQTWQVLSEQQIHMQLVVQHTYNWRDPEASIISEIPCNTCCYTSKSSMDLTPGHFSSGSNSKIYKCTRPPCQWCKSLESCVEKFFSTHQHVHLMYHLHLQVVLKAAL